VAERILFWSKSKLKDDARGIKRRFRELQLRKLPLTLKADEMRSEGCRDDFSRI